MDIITKIIYLGLLIICAGFFYMLGYKDGVAKACDEMLKFITEYEKKIMKIIKAEDYNDKK